MVGVKLTPNLRASAFSYLYRTLKLGVPANEARAVMETVWVPTETWQLFIDELSRR